MGKSDYKRELRWIIDITKFNKNYANAILKLVKKLIDLDIWWVCTLIKNNDPDI